MVFLILSVEERIRIPNNIEKLKKLYEKGSIPGIFRNARF